MAFFLILSENNARHSTPWGHLVRYSTMTDPFDVLADSTRRDIVDLLRAPSPKPLEMSVGELVDALGITQPTVSKHLKVLRDSGLVQVREDGQHRYYRFDDAPLGVIRKWVGAQTAPAPASARDHSTSTELRVAPFADLGPLGRATGGLVKDSLALVNRLILGARR